MAKGHDAGKQFLAGVLAKISDPEKRAQVQAALEDPASADALEMIGVGTLAQSDINKKYDELKSKEDSLTEDYNRLNAWFADNKAKLEEYDTLKKGQPTPPVVPPVAPVPDLSKFIDQDTFHKTMQQEQMAAANYLGLQNVLTLSHYKDFGEILDTRELLADKRLGLQLPDGRVFGLKDAYEAKFSDKIAERDKTREQQRVQKLVDEGVAERLKGMPQQQAYPLKGAPSPLDLLEPGATQKPDDPAFSVDAAVAEYHRLQQARSAAS